MSATEKERRDLAEEFPRWHVWQWNGLVYARRLKRSPPIVLRAADTQELRRQMTAAEGGTR